MKLQMKTGHCLQKAINIFSKKQKYTMPEPALKTEKIIISNTLTLKEWSRILDCEEKDLMKAIGAVGNSLQAVDDYLILNRQKLS